MKSLLLLVDALTQHRRSVNFSSETIASQALALRRFVTWVDRRYGISTTDRLAPRHLHAYQQHLAGHRTCRGTPLKPGTVNNQVKALRGWLTFMYQRGFTSQELITAIAYVKAPRRLPNVLEHSELRKLLNRIDTTTAIGYRNRAIAELLYSSGVRSAELRGLDLGDVDLENATLRVMGKGRKERIVPVGRTAHRYLEGYIRAVRPFWTGAATNQALFLSKYGTRFSKLALRWFINSGFADAPIRITPHSFRRSYTTELIRADANIYHVKELLGHTSLQSLQPYVKLTISDLKKTHAKCHPRERDEKRLRG